MTVLLSALASLLLGVGFVLQQRAAARAPMSDLLTFRLFADLLHYREWVLGLLSMISGQILSGLALGQGKLTVVEPVLATNLLFALFLASRLSRERLGRVEWAGVIALSAGVAAFTLTVRWSDQWSPSLTTAARWPSAGGMGLLALLLAWAGRRRSRPESSATLFAAGAGLCFGIQDALTRRVIGALENARWMAVIADWPAYCLIAVAVVGLLLMQSAFRLAPLRVSLPLVTSLEALGGITLGILVFGDGLDVAPAALVVEGLSLAAMVAGVFVVGRHELLASGGQPTRTPEGGRGRC